MRRTTAGFATPLVTGAPFICFYAGVPIRARGPGGGDRLPMGTLCVIDDRPHIPDPAQLALLVDLAHVVETLLEARSATARANALATERGRTLQRQDRINRQFRQAERMANFGSWRLTLADNRTEWSEQTYAIYGLPPGTGTPLDTALDFYPSHARPVIADAVARTMATGEPFSVETDFRTAQGEYRRVQAIGEIELENGVPVALIGVFHDVTERYALEQALRDAARSMSCPGWRAPRNLTRSPTRASLPPKSTIRRLPCC